MNVVLVTSVIRPVNDRTVFSANQRIDQTVNTIETIRDKIPRSYIVMIEGGTYDAEELRKYKNIFSHLVDYFIQVDISKLTKSPGEATLLYQYLISDHFLSLKNVETVSKLSGRYYLNDSFKWDTFPSDKIIIRFVPVSWMGTNMYLSRYYRIPKQYVQHFIDGLSRYINSNEFRISWPDMEHCLHYHNIIKHDVVYSPARLGVCGLITGNHEFVSD